MASGVLPAAESEMIVTGLSGYRGTWVWAWLAANERMTEEAKMVTLMAVLRSRRNAIHSSLALLMKGKSNKVIAKTLNMAVLHSQNGVTAVCNESHRSIDKDQADWPGMVAEILVIGWLSS
jgi:hypothetical protein